MKPLINSIAGLLAASLATTAAATPTKIYIAGSNGDRVITNTAIAHVLGAGNFIFAGTSSDYTKANFGVFTGGSINGTPVTIKVSYIGAAGGIAALAGSLPVNFVPDGVSGGSVPDPTVTGNANDPEVPTFAFSTNFQATTPFSGTYQGHYYSTLDDFQVGIIPLKWVASKGYPGTNLSTQQAQLLWSVGYSPLSVFTGNPANSTVYVYATGRNTDSGQRYEALAEPGLGVNAYVKQYKPTITGQAAGVGGYIVGGTVTSQALWPIETFSGVSSQYLGNSGATTGSNLAPYLTAVLSSAAYKVASASATAGYYISYLTIGDANTIAIPNGAVELTYNGVQYSEQNVDNGQYTFWVYEHVLTTSNYTSGTSPGANLANALINQITNTDAAVGGILLSNAVVSRTGEGTLVTP